MMQKIIMFKFGEKNSSTNLKKWGGRKKNKEKYTKAYHNQIVKNK